MSFKKNKYQVCRKIISQELSEFLFNYLRIKKQTFYSLKRAKIRKPGRSVSYGRRKAIRK